MTRGHATPGPYTYRPGEDGWEIMAEFAESPLAVVPFWPDEDGLASAEAEANANLFASSWQLVEALRAVLLCAKEEAESLDEHRGYGESVNAEADAARAAVRLAEEAIAGIEGATI